MKNIERVKNPEKAKSLGHHNGKNIVLRKNGKKRVFTSNFEPSRADQSQLPNADVNSIFAKYKKTGEIEFRNAGKGVHADLTNVPDLASALDRSIKAQQAFLDLPATLRARFSNSPTELISFLSDKNNREEAINLGLIIAPKAAPAAEAKAPVEGPPSAKNSNKTKSQPTQPQSQPQTPTPSNDDD